jgi:8-oxo-dGTP pyrophosphatase MutT (NUDIX family)
MPISDYLRGIRGKVGHDLVVLPAVSVSVLNSEGRLLLGQDTDFRFWTLPGGAVDPHEQPADAAARECYEETGLLVKPTGLIGVFGGPEFLVRYRNGDVAYYTAIAFKATLIGGTKRPVDGEMSELRYFSQEECESLNISAASRLIAKATFAHSAEAFFQPATISAQRL